MMIKKCISYTLLLLLFPLALHAGEPLLDRYQQIGITNWKWRINSAAKHTLNLFKSDTANPAAKYDLAACMFCSGEDDGCEQDGIFDIALQRDISEPLLVVVCHIGAHSRMLQIFAPRRDKENAVHTVTGDFIIDYQVDPQGMTVKYDRRNESGEFTQKLSRWPQPIDDSGK